MTLTASYDRPVIAFGTAVAGEGSYEQLALPGIERARETDSLVLTRTDLPIARAYNEILEEAAAVPGLEGVVLLHQDLELSDDSLPARLRSLFRDRSVGLVGPLGARGATPHLWLGPEKEMYGVVSSPTLERRFSTGPHEVDGIDGALMVLAPWAVRGVRFGEPPERAFHGYDVDVSLRVRALGGRVICDDIPYFHHRRPKHDYEAQRRAGIALGWAWDAKLRRREWAPSFRL